MIANQMRSTELIRAIQAVTAGVQAGLGILAGTEVLSPRIVVIIMALIAVSQVGVATWNQGLHNDPKPNPEYSPKPDQKAASSDDVATVQLYPPGRVER